MTESKKKKATDLNRRSFLTSMSIAIAGASLVDTAARAEAPHLPLADPTAQALGYTENSAAVDETKYATHKAGMQCNNCNFFQGTPDTAYAPCQLYSGKLVNAKGWCSGYAKKA